MDASAQQNSIIVSGLSHKATMLSMRERFALSPEGMSQTLRTIRTLPGVREAVVISTCNRLEIVGNVGSSWKSLCASELERLFESISGISRKDFSSEIYHLRDDVAVSHLFRVASGLDSLVVGEPQILGQLKEAFRLAQEQGATKAILHRLFTRAFGVAKAIRTHTNIGRRAVSICYAARELAGHIFGDLNDAAIMIFGAGETGGLALRHFYNAGVRKIFIVNRTMERGVSLAREYGAVPLSFENYRDFLSQVDIVIGASTVEIDTMLVNDCDVQRAQGARFGRPQFFVDLGVPRNFDEKIGDLSGAFLYNLDDLEEVVRENINARALEVDEAELIITDEVHKFTKWLKARVIDLTIGELMERCGEFQALEQQRTLRRLRAANFTNEQMTLIANSLNAYGDALLAKTLHRPLHELKQRSMDDEEVLTSFRNFFLPKKQGSS